MILGDMASNIILRGGGSQTKESSVSGIIAASSNKFSGWTQSKYKTLAAEGYNGNSIGFRCIDEKARAVASVKWKGKRMTAKGPVDAPEHPFSRILHRANNQPGGSFRSLIYRHESFYGISGNGYFECVPNAQGEPVELYSQRPDRMVVNPSAKGVGSYDYIMDGQIKNGWPVDQASGKSMILHIKTFNPVDDFYGLSPLAVAIKDIDIHNCFAIWNKNMLENDYRPGIVVTTDKPLSPRQREDAESELRREKLGYWNAGEPMILEPGMDVKNMSIAPKDVDYLQGRAAVARDICHPFGMSPLMINLPGDSTYSNYKEARVAFWEGPVRWDIELLDAELNWWIYFLYNDDTYYIEPCLENTPAVAEREQMLWDRAEKSASILKVDERREIIKYPVYDEKGTGDTIYSPSTVVPLEALAGSRSVEARKSLSPDLLDKFKSLREEFQDQLLRDPDGYPDEVVARLVNQAFPL